MTDMNFSAIFIEIAIAVLLLLVLLLDLMRKRGSGLLPAYVTALGLTGILALAISCYPTDGTVRYFFQGFYAVDAYSIFFKILFLLGTLFTVLYGARYVARRVVHVGEFYALMLAALLGMCVLASANDLVTVFVGLELMTISFYVLVAIQTDNVLSTEAGVKYLIYGSAATGALLYGISLVYGMTGSLAFDAIARSPGLFLGLGIAGMVLTLAGFFFKLSIIPFHLWAPDVYEGAPAPVTALLAMCSKAAGIAVMLRVIVTALPQAAPMWTEILAIFAFVSMVGGNLMAFCQSNIKRMLAYSSIAQAGYMMCAMAAASADGLKSVLFYAAVYLFANIAAFVTVSYLEDQRGTDLRDVRGLAHRSLLPAGLLMVALLTMAGIPPTAGFIGKFYIFTATVDAGLFWLAAVGFAVSMMSVYYYLIVIREMFRDLSGPRGRLLRPRHRPLGAAARRLHQSDNPADALTPPGFTCKKHKRQQCIVCAFSHMCICGFLRAPHCSARASFSAMASWSAHEVPRPPQSLPLSRTATFLGSAPSSSLPMALRLPGQPPMKCTSWSLPSSPMANVICLAQTPCGVKEYVFMISLSFSKIFFYYMPSAKGLTSRSVSRFLYCALNY